MADERPFTPERRVRGPATFRERDVKAAIRAARKAGETGAVRVEIEDHRVVVIIGGQDAVDIAPDLRKEIEEWQP